MRKTEPIPTIIATLALVAASLGTTAAQSETSPTEESELADAMAPAWVTGTIPWVGTPMGRTETTFENGVERIRDDGWTGMRAEMSDARISGELTSLWNTDTYEGADGEPIEVQSGIYRVENEGGSWQSASHALYGGPSDGKELPEVAVLIGEGGYAGLRAFLVLDWTDYGPSNPVRVEGAIFPGSLPPMPTLE